MQHLIKEFHEKFNCPIAGDDPFMDLYKEHMKLRTSLYEEEFGEFYDAITAMGCFIVEYKEAMEHNNCDIVLKSFGVNSFDEGLIKFQSEALKEMADVLYVLYGMAVTLGWDLDGALKEVHRSNMTKLDKDGNVIYNAEGKVLKSTLYEPADVTPYVNLNTL